LLMHVCRPACMKRRELELWPPGMPAGEAPRAIDGRRRAGAMKRPTDPNVGLFTPQTTAKSGKTRTPADSASAAKALQILRTRKQRCTTENRGVPGSSPGLAIHKGAAKQRLFFARDRWSMSADAPRSGFVAQSWPNGAPAACHFARASPRCRPAAVSCSDRSRASAAAQTYLSSSRPIRRLSPSVGLVRFQSKTHTPSRLESARVKEKLICNSHCCSIRSLACTTG
jgi:hypothetical protein